MTIEGIGKKARDILEKSRFDTVDKIANASVEKLKDFRGIGEKSAEKMIASAKDVIRRLQEEKKEARQEEKKEEKKEEKPEEKPKEGEETPQEEGETGEKDSKE